MALNQKAIKVLGKVFEAGFTDEKSIAAMTMDDILVRTALRIPPKKKQARTSVVRTARTSVPYAENVCVRTSAASNVLPSTEFGYPNSLVRG